MTRSRILARHVRTCQSIPSPEARAAAPREGQRRVLQQITGTQGIAAAARQARAAYEQMETPTVTLDDVRSAAVRIAPYIHRTPLFDSATLSRLTGTRLGLKAENLQRTGAFKARGALNAVLRLSPGQRERGVVTLSAGNHGQGLAYAAQIAGVRCVVFMPENAVPTKVAAVREYGAEARFAPSMETVFAAMDEYRDAHGLHYVHPFGDPDIIAGQGTVGLEIMEDSPEVDTIAVCVGGGGLLAGIAVAAKGFNPAVRIVGVEPEGAPAVTRSLIAGYPVTIEKITTVADGLAAPFAAPTSQRLIERLVDDVVIVTDGEILSALRLLLERTKLLVEPAGAAATAALLTGKAGVAPGSRAVATLSGGNVDFETLKSLL
jgi:threonine dehydratase